MICDKYISKILGVSHVCLFFYHCVKLAWVSHGVSIKPKCLHVSVSRPSLPSLVFSQCTEFLCVCFSVSCFNVIVSIPVCVMFGSASLFSSVRLWSVMFPRCFLCALAPTCVFIVRICPLWWSPSSSSCRILGFFFRTVKCVTNYSNSIKNTPEGIDSTKNDREYPFCHSNYVSPGRHCGYTLQSASLNPASRWMND